MSLPHLRFEFWLLSCQLAVVKEVRYIVRLLSAKNLLQDIMLIHPVECLHDLTTL